MELEAELGGSTVLQEGATIRAELRQVTRRLAEREHLMDELAGLPELWEHIYGEGPGFLVLFSGVRPTPDADLQQPHQAFFAWGQEQSETQEALAWIEREAADDRELYQGAHLTTRWRRRKEDAAPFASLFVDLDRPLPEPVPVEPTITVETSPGHFQLYVRLWSPVAPAVGEHLNRRLAAAFGGDPSGWDASQVMRVVGSVNHKYSDKPLVRLVAESGLEYDAEELAHQLPDVAAIAPRRPVLPAGELPKVGQEPPVKLTSSGRALWNGELATYRPTGEIDRSATLVRIARMLHQAGVPREGIVACLAERDVSLGWLKYAERERALEHYEQLVAVVLRGSPTRHRR